MVVATKREGPYSYSVMRERALQLQNGVSLVRVHLHPHVFFLASPLVAPQPLLSRRRRCSGNARRLSCSLITHPPPRHPLARIGPRACQLAGMLRLKPPPVKRFIDARASCTSTSAGVARSSLLVSLVCCSRFFCSKNFFLTSRSSLVIRAISYLYSLAWTRGEEVVDSRAG